MVDVPSTRPPFLAMLSEPLSRIPLPLLRVLRTGAPAALVARCTTGYAAGGAALGLPVMLALLLTSPVHNHLRLGHVGLFLDRPASGGGTEGTAR